MCKTLPPNAYGFLCYDNLTKSKSVLKYNKILEIYNGFIRNSFFFPFVIVILNFNAVRKFCMKGQKMQEKSNI
jgi:hypothetical protein